jgi:hypothetical protein
MKEAKTSDSHIIVLYYHVCLRKRSLLEPPLVMYACYYVINKLNIISCATFDYFYNAIALMVL